MGTVMATDRLALRPFTMGDVRDAQRLYADIEVWEFDPGHEQSDIEIAKMVQYRISQYERNGFGALAIDIKDTGEFIGHCGLQTYVWETMPFASVETELFFKLGRPYWGQGYATEACTTMLDFAFRQLRLPRIISWTHRENRRALALMRRLGMELKAERDQPDLIAGVILNKTNLVQD